MEVDSLFRSLEPASAWLETHAPLHVLALALAALVLIWWRVRHRTEPSGRECRACGEGYRLSSLKPRARDGAQMAVRCPSCDSWYAVATTNRDVYKVDEGYVMARWPSLQKH